MHRLYKLSCEMSIGYILEEEKAMHMWNCRAFCGKKRKAENIEAKVMEILVLTIM